MIFEDKTSELYLSDKKAEKISKSLTELIKIAPIKIGVLCASKSELKKFLNIKSNEDFKGSEQKKRDKEIAYEVLAAHLFWWFANFTKKERARGAIVAESRKNADYTLLRAYLRCKEQGTFQSAVLKKSCDNMRDTISSIRFENKIGVWPGLELADIISYISFLKLNNRLQKFKKRGLVPVWHEFEKKIEKNKIRQIRDSGFKKYIKSDRVRK